MENLPNTIKEWFDLYLRQDCYFSGPGSGVRTEELKLIINIYLDKADNYIIFNNAGGRSFHVWYLKSEPEKVIEHLKSYTFAYKLNGKEVILKNPPNY